MQVVILKEVVSSIAGEKSKGIIDLLVDKKNVNEFLIAKKLKLTINQTRNVLYKLADEGIVSFIRKKDNKKGGWYTYFWTLNPDKGLIKSKDELFKKIEALKQDIHGKKTERFYYSPNCSLDFTEEAALTHDYVCPECGEILQLKDNSKESALLEKELARNEALIEKVNIEIGILDVKNQKTRLKRMKAEEKKKKEEKEAKKKKRQRELKKLGKLKVKIPAKGKKPKSKKRGR